MYHSRIHQLGCRCYDCRAPFMLADRRKDRRMKLAGLGFLALGVGFYGFALYNLGNIAAALTAGAR